MSFGTLMTLDTLASLNNTLVPDIGEDRVFQAIQDALTVHNELLSEKISTLVDTTTNRLMRYGGVDNMTMDEIDEGGRPDAQKITAGATVGFPLRLYGISVQWTRKYLQNAVGSEMATQFIAARDANVKLMDREIKRALFGSTNFTFVDKLVDGVSLSVKRLLNADSSAIPLDPSGNSFNGATHTHYLGTASLVVADIVALIETVVEHFGSGSAVVYINRAQETAVRAMTGFVPYTDARIIPADTSVRSAQALDSNLLYNRAIGILSSGGDTAEIWVKPWIPANYMFAYVQGQPKPLVRRERRPGSSALVVAAEDESYPLRAQTLDSEFGIGVLERRNGAVLLTNNATYSAPTFT